MERGYILAAVIASLWCLLSGCGGKSQGLSSTLIPTPTTTATATQFIFPSTYTPSVTTHPTSTHTPGPSRTPIPTNTAASTLPPSSTPLVEIRTAAELTQPSTSSRLLYMNVGEIKIWDSISGSIQTIEQSAHPEGISHISISSDGIIIAAAGQVAGMTVITLIDRAENEIIRTLEVEGGGLFDMQISPDGQTLVYITSGVISQPEATPTPFPTNTPAGTQETARTATPTGLESPTPDVSLSREIYIVDIQGAGSPVFITECEPVCTRVIWSPSSDFIAWGQTDGLWTFEPQSSLTPDQLLEPFISGVSAGVQTTGSYLPLKASPSGRFIVVRKGIQTGSVLAAVDRFTGTVENLPGTGSYTGESTGWTWLSGDRLFIARPGIEAGGILPAAEIWALSPATPPGLFSRLAEHPLPGGTGVLPAAPVELPDGRVGFGLVNLRDGNDAEVNGLYILNPETGDIQRINFLPLLLLEKLVWLPDASGALVLSESRILFVPGNFGPVYTLRALLGAQACCFQWIP